MRILACTIITLATLTSCGPGAPEITDTASLITAMNAKNRNNWFSNFIFKQETIRFREGQPTDTAIWFEAIRYPDHFRIDFDPENQQAVIFKQDSSYRISNDSLLNVRHNPQEFLLFKGGLYFYSPEETLSKLESYGYDINQFTQAEWEGREVYIVGAAEGDLSKKQFWLDAEHFFAVRRISINGNGQVIDAQYRHHEKFDGGWVERQVTFYRDGELFQDEFYQDVKVNVSMGAEVFDHRKPVYGWFKGL